ncbi:proteasome assembly chaperone 2 [Musca domestica]|uniref:Proteasome assembly chaperone 2 n=1 Tax=Musca domestica TaxID=7370 RepID=A0A1I8MYE8_MUSDO|nr:proteasome assembly chaperone 2 [Musca domestica]
MFRLQLKDNVRLEDFKGYTVIIPSICIGNAAQLACDLLISSKNLKRVASISHPALIPCYGPSAFQHEPEEKIAACELYSCPDSKLLVFQFRSPFISTHMTSFHKELANTLNNAEKVIVLSGSLGFEKRIIDSCPYEYKASESFKGIHGDRLQNMKWKEFGGEMIFGGGNALDLYKIMDEQNVPVMILFRYLLEGDNSTDAALILSELSELCKDFLALNTDVGGLQLKVPISWKLLFGNDIPELIF